MTWRRSDDGFTLIELLISVAISTIIAGAIGAAVSAGARSTNSTKLRLGASHDAETSARWFSGDAASTDADSGDVVHLNVSPTPACNGSHTPLITFEWTEQTASSAGVKTPSVHVVEWVVEGTALVRESCVNSVTGAHLFMVKNLSGTPVVTCQNAAHATVACTATHPATVTSTGIAVTTTPDPRDPNPLDVFKFTLSGTVRDQPTPPGGVVPPGALVPLLTVGTSNTLSISGNGQMLVQGGTPIINSDYTAGKKKPPGLTVTPSGTVDATGTCTGGAGCSGVNNVVLQAPVPDPLAALPAPPVPATATFPACGHYTAAISITSSTVLNPTGNVNCVYYLDAGLSVSGGSTVLSTSPAGALIYISGGSFNCSGQAQCTLKPLVGATGSTAIYDQIAIFQSRTDSTEMSIEGQGAQNTYSGLIYAPDADVLTSGIGGAVITWIISKSVTVGGNGTVRVGP